MIPKVFDLGQFEFEAATNLTIDFIKLLRLVLQQSKLECGIILELVIGRESLPLNTHFRYLIEADDLVDAIPIIDEGI